MAIRALYENKEAPLALIVDMYNNVLVPSIAGKSKEGYTEMSESIEYDYFATATVDKCDFIDWSATPAGASLCDCLASHEPLPCATEQDSSWL